MLNLGLLTIFKAKLSMTVVRHANFILILKIENIYLTLPMSVKFKKNYLKFKYSASICHIKYPSSFFY